MASAAAGDGIAFRCVTAAHHDDMRLVAAALARLDPDDAALLAMRCVAGFGSNELALATGISPSGTRSRIEWLLKRLRGRGSRADADRRRRRGGLVPRAGRHPTCGDVRAGGRVGDVRPCP
jgi:DNA-directed RNA polymerase specialized sigma24 family protein